MGSEGARYKDYKGRPSPLLRMNHGWHDLESKTPKTKQVRNRIHTRWSHREYQRMQLDLEPLTCLPHLSTSPSPLR